MNKFYLGTIAFLVLVVAGCLFFFQFNASKSVYADTTTVYNNFKLKKEVEEKYLKAEDARKIILDSLRLKINLLENETNMGGNIKSNEEKRGLLNFLGQQYYAKEKQFAEDNEALAKKYTDEIWEQLNQYIADFGKEKKYQFIFGSVSRGTLLYSEEGCNVTQELQDYVNDRYDGKN